MLFAILVQCTAWLVLPYERCALTLALALARGIPYLNGDIPLVALYEVLSQRFSDDLELTCDFAVART